MAVMAAMKRYQQQTPAVRAAGDTRPDASVAVVRAVDVSHR
jgi:hypothetical protein